MGILDFIGGKKEPAPTTATQDKPAAVAESAPAAAPAPASGPTLYEVKSGDTLWKIAEAYYGHGHGAKYTDIFEANKDQLKDPDSIRPGQKLRIPAAGAAHAAASAPAGEWKPPQEIAAKSAASTSGGVEWKPPQEIANKKG